MRISVGSFRDASICMADLSTSDWLLRPSLVRGLASHIVTWPTNTKLGLFLFNCGEEYQHLRTVRLPGSYSEPGSLYPAMYPERYPNENQYDLGLLVDVW